MSISLSVKSTDLGLRLSGVDISIGFARVVAYLARSKSIPISEERIDILSLTHLAVEEIILVKTGFRCKANLFTVVRHLDHLGDSIAELGSFFG